MVSLASGCLIVVYNNTPYSSPLLNSHSKVYQAASPPVGGGGGVSFHRQCEWNRSSKFCISFSWNLIMRVTFYFFYIHMGKTAPQLEIFKILWKEKMQLSHKVILKWKELVLKNSIGLANSAPNCKAPTCRSKISEQRLWQVLCPCVVMEKPL